MKTKIAVCSSSGIDYIAHSDSIASIPVILKFSEEEQYLDAKDITADAFYNRIRMDVSAKMVPSFQTYAMICDFINQIRIEKYEQIMFILASKNFSDLYVSVSLALSQNQDIKAYIYDSNTVGYPLAYMAIEADRMFNEGDSYENVNERLKLLERINELYFFRPKYRESSFFFKKHYKTGDSLCIQDGQLVSLSKASKKALEEMVLKFCEHIKDIDMIPFILYTSKTSKYIQIIQRNLELMDKRLKKIKIYPMAPVVGNQAGIYSICLGYVLK